MASSNKLKEAISKQLNKLDKEGEEYMKHAEKKCWKLKSGRIPFSPKHLCGSGRVKCIGLYYVGMLARYGIAGTCNAHQGNVRLKHHSSCQLKISSSGFGSARKNASKSMGNDIDSNI